LQLHFQLLVDLLSCELVRVHGLVVVCEFAHPYKLALVCEFAHAYTFAFEFKTIIYCFASKFLMLFLVYSFPMGWSVTTHKRTFFVPMEV
jgi:hypothetical protein